MVTSLQYFGVFVMLDHFVIGTVYGQLRLKHDKIAVTDTVSEKSANDNQSGVHRRRPT